MLPNEPFMVVEVMETIRDSSKRWTRPCRSGRQHGRLAKEFQAFEFLVGSFACD
jgi:hypothetical protein